LKQSILMGFYRPEKAAGQAFTFACAPCKTPFET